MSTDVCARWHGAIAMDALGSLPDGEHAGLRAHLDGCSACREAADELRSTASFLNFVDAGDVTQFASVSPELTGRVLGQLHRVEVLSRRRRVVGVVAATMAVAASAFLAVALSAASPSTAPHTAVTEHLIGPNAAAATVTLAAQTWGTSVTLYDQHQQAGVFTVSMRTSSGAWWPTGSYRGVAGRAIDVQMSCAVPLGAITGVRVTDARGTTVLWSEAASVPDWGSPSRL